MTEVELAWVAGLLEGEGSFTFRYRGSGTDRNICVQCHMTDLDVLEKLQRSAGGSVNGPYKNGSKAHHKPRYMWRLHGPSARNLMGAILPHMGRRRSERIQELIDAFDAVETKSFKLLNVETGQVEVTDNLEKWARDNQLQVANLYRTLSGERSHHKGWRRLT